MELIRTGMLLDLYGSLLTKRQFNIIDLYVNYDLSLSEISQQLNISRQGVHDNIKRAKAQLEQYESKLGLYVKLKINRKKTKEAINELDKGNIEKVKDILNEIAER